MIETIKDSSVVQHISCNIDIEGTDKFIKGLKHKYVEVPINKINISPSIYSKIGIPYDGEMRYFPIKDAAFNKLMKMLGISSSSNKALEVVSDQCDDWSTIYDKVVLSKLNYLETVRKVDTITFCLDSSPNVDATGSDPVIRGVSFDYPRFSIADMYRLWLDKMNIFIEKPIGMHYDEATLTVYYSAVDGLNSKLKDIHYRYSFSMSFNSLLASFQSLLFIHITICIFIYLLLLYLQFQIYQV